MASSDAYDEFAVIEPQRSSDTVYGDFERHSGAQRMSTILTIASSLRARYPDHALTMVMAWDCNLLSFASAGQAQAVLDPGDNQNLILRTFVPPARRLNGDAGALASAIKFAKFNYRWKGHDFILYIVDGDRDNAAFGAGVVNYILRKREGEPDQQPQDSVSDGLVAAASKYGLDLHQEILVYDQGYWQKNHELWESVQKSFWSDVILDDDVKRSLIQDVEGFFDERDQYREFEVPWKASSLNTPPKKSANARNPLLLSPTSGRGRFGNPC